MRILSRLCALLLWPMACWGQSVTVPAQQGTTTAPVVPAQTVTITTKNGGKETFTVPAQTLKPLTVTIPALTAPVSLSGFTGGFTCALSPTGKFVINPDQTITVTGLSCTITPQAAQ